MDRETAGEEVDSSESSSDDETPGMTMRSVSPAQPLLQPSSDSVEEAEPDDLHSGAGALVPSAAMAGAAPDREPLTVQRASPLEAPVSYSAARLRTERGVVELPAPPANIRMEASGEMSGHMTGVNYDMSHQYTYNVDRAFFTRGAMQEITRHLRSGSHPAIQSGSSSGTIAEAVARMLMPGQSVPAMSDLGPGTDAEGADSTLPSALLDCKIRALKEDFVETDTFQSLERRLLDQALAVVVGPTGEGKSSNAIMLCDRLRGKGYLSTYFESLHEIESHLESIAKCRRNLCLVVDNVFGTSILDTANLGRWSQVLSNLIAVQTAGSLGGGQGVREEGNSERKKSLVLLLLSRDNVFSEALKKASNLPAVIRDSACQISMKSADSLQKEEKRQLLRKYTEKVGKPLSEKDENAIIGFDVPIGFPQVCRLYNDLNTVHGKPVDFFSRPTALLLDTIKEMIREDAMVRTALALLVLQGGSLPLQSLQIPDKRETCEINTALQAIKEELGDLGNKGEAFQELLKTFETLCEGLLTEERGRVTFSHDTVRDAVCVALADYNLPFVAKHCSLAVLSQCILLDDSSRSSFCQIRNQSVLAVPRGQWPLFTKRLVSELEKGKFRDVFTSSFASLPGFCAELTTECLKSNSVSKVVHKADVDCGLNFSFWASMASPNFLTRLLPLCTFEAWELWQGIVGCCVKGHLNLLRNMHQSLPEKRVEDWSVPISDWFRTCQREKGERSGSQSRCPPSSSECRWDNLPVGCHAIPGTVAAEHGHVNVLKTLIDLGMSADVRDPQQCTPLMSACSGGQKDVITFLVTSHKFDLTAADKRGSTPLHKLAEGGHGDVACWLVEEHMHDCVLNACINKVNDELQTPLMLACRNAPKLATLLLAKGATVRTNDSTNKSCLHYTAEGGNPLLLKKLLDLKILDVNQMSTSGWSPLHFACSRPKNLEVVQILFKYRAEAKPQDKNSKDTPLHVAVKQGCLEVVQALVESSSEVIAACESVKATSPFLLACRSGNLDIVKYLHEKMADVLKRDEIDGSSLHCAVSSGNVNTLCYLIDETRAEVELRNKYGLTPFLLACLFGKVEIVKCLTKRKADSSVVDANGNTALHHAALSGEVDTVCCVMDELGVHVDVKDRQGHTPLLAASHKGRVQVVKYLKDRHADLAAVDEDGDTALHHAAISGDVDTVCCVMDELGVHADVKNKHGQTPLLTACNKGSVQVVKYLKDRHADLAAVDEDGRTALHHAALSGDVDTVCCVMDELGVHADVKNRRGLTPLLTACNTGSVQVVKFLKDRHADLAAVDAYGNTALHHAVLSRDVDTACCVMDELGVHVDVKNNQGRTPLLLACNTGSAQVVKYLKDRHADLAAVDEDGDTALHHAALSGDVDTVCCVMDELGVHADVKNRRGLTPLLTACNTGSVQVVKFLKDRHADLAAVDAYGNTVLHHAALSGDVDTVCCVMDELGVHVDVKNKQGKTPLLLACNRGRVQVVKFQKDRNADLAAVDENGNTALHHAVLSGDVDTVCCVMDELGVHADVKNKKGETPLLAACNTGRVQVVKYLKDRHADLATVDEDGDTALHHAAISGDVDTVCCVMDELGVHVDVKNKRGLTPLLAVCNRGRVQVVKYLKDRQADLAAVDEDGDTALHHAAISGDVDTVCCVMDELGVHVDVKNKRGLTPLLAVCNRGRVQVVKYLKDRHADLAAVDEDGNTALHHAAISGDVDTVCCVMDELGVHADVKNKQEKTPLLTACNAGTVQVVKYLKDRHADLAAVDEDGDTTLHHAALSGDVDTVCCVMDELGVHADVKNNQGRTPLLTACYTGRVQVVKYLKDRHADLAAVDEDGNPALHHAVLNGDVDTVCCVMDELGVHVDVKDRQGQTPLLIACNTGRVQVVKYLKDRHADLAAVDEDGDTALHHAVLSGDVDTVCCVMDELGVHVDVKDNQGKTPLLLACNRGSVQVVKYLKDRHADLAAVDEDGDTALHHAALSGDVDTVCCVMDELGVHVDVKDKHGQTPLLTACNTGSVQVVKYLKDRHADLAAVDEDGNTALHHAAFSGDVDTVCCVMDELGVHVDVKDRQGQTPLLLACNTGSVQVVKYLKDRHADLAAVDGDGDTALHHAALSGDVDTVCCVLDELGVHVDVKDKQERTPLLAACNKGSVQVVKFLKDRHTDLAAVDEDGNTALHHAAISGDVDTVCCVLDELGVHAGVKNKKEQTPILTACNKGRVQTVKYLKDRLADLAAVDEDGNTALHHAAFSGDVDTVCCVMDELGVNVDVKDKQGQTPLLVACNTGSVQVVKYLKDRHADLAAADANGNTAFHHAALSGDVDTVCCVMDELGVHADVKNKHGQTPLLTACNTGSVQVVKYLKDRHADLAAVDEDGNTALHYAVYSGDLDTVCCVMDELGVHVDVKNKHGQSPLLLACNTGRVQVVKFLNERHADLAAVDEDGNTALHHAALSGDMDTVCCVMDELGVQADMRNKQGQTPFLLAFNKGKVEVVKYLKEGNADSSPVD